MKKSMAVLMAMTFMGFAGVASAVPASAVPIVVPGLFTTGVDDAGNVLTAGSVDTHYRILETGDNAVAIETNPVWVPGTSNSSWIWESYPSVTALTFRTTVDLSGIDLTTLLIAGQWSTDNNGIDIVVNGVSSAQTCDSFLVYCDFSLSGAFIDGLNTVDFIVSNGGGPAGFLLDSISAYRVEKSASVSEPGSLALLMLALGITAGVATRRKNKR